MSGGSTKLRQVIDDYLRRRAVGEAVDRGQIIAAHADLMPELGTEFRKLALIENACMHADRPLVAEETDDTAPDRPDESWAAPPPPDAFPGLEITGTIHQEGRSGMFHANREDTRQYVSIFAVQKNPLAGSEQDARFHRRVQVLKSLNHPHIVTILGSGSIGGYLYAVMDPIAGPPLDEYVDEHLAGLETPIKDVLHLFLKICHAINAAHLRGVIHRDLAPRDIRVDPKGEPRILGFGLGKISDGDAQASASWTATASVQDLDSLPWTSPEHVDSGAGALDARSDVYSLGVILFHILTGRCPYHVVGDCQEVADRIILDEPIRPSTFRRQIDVELEAIVLKCLNKERDHRYQSAGDLAGDIDRYLHGQPVEAVQGGTWYVFKKAIGRCFLRKAMRP